MAVFYSQPKKQEIRKRFPVFCIRIWLDACDRKREHTERGKCLVILKKEFSPPFIILTVFIPH
jgi:hypothetical protein